MTLDCAGLVVQDLDGTEHFRCICGSPDHQFDLSWDEEEAWITIHLSPAGTIFERIARAVRYVFGYRSRYGDWDCPALSEADVKRLHDATAKILRAREP